MDTDPHTASTVPSVIETATPLSEQEQKDHRFADALSDAMVKTLKPLHENKDPTATPATKDGLIDKLILMMRK